MSETRMLSEAESRAYSQGFERGRMSDGYVIADASGKRFRIWNHGPEWTDDLDAALWFVRLGDAESFCADDDDAWHITLASVFRREIEQNT